MPSGLAAYEVACGCGEVARGPRLPRPQTIRCPRCGEDLFVLPLSPLPPVTEGGGAGQGGPRRLRPWLLPAAAALATATGLVLLYLFVIAPLTNDTPPAGPPAPPPVHLAERLDAARAHLGLGHFHLAVEELQALDTAARQSGSGSKAQRRELALLLAQASLMADLLSESLEEILTHAASVPDREWQAEFRRRYRGRAVVFDMEVRTLEAGRFEHDWQLRVRGERGHLELNNLEFLARLPGERPARLLFGGRLAGINREPGRGWVVRLEPDSGVLLTDPGAAAACALAPADPDIAELLRRQSAWSDALRP